MNPWEDRAKFRTSENQNNCELHGVPLRVGNQQREGLKMNRKLTGGAHMKNLGEI